MARFHDVVGFAGAAVETSPGVWKEPIVEKTYTGDIVQNIRRLQEGESVNDDLSLQNSASILADAYASENFFAIRYVKWMGEYWKVITVQVQRPRLILRLGGVYNGPKAS